MAVRFISQVRIVMYVTIIASKILYYTKNDDFIIKIKEVI